MEPIMRSYPRNSPQAAARIVAMMMLADGHACHSESTALGDLPPDESLGISRETLLDVMQDFCQDIQTCGQHQWSDASCLDERTIACFLSEIDDPFLRRKLLNLCACVVEADHHVSEGEALLMSAAIESWGMQREMLARPARTLHFPSD